MCFLKDNSLVFVPLKFGIQVHSQDSQFFFGFQNHFSQSELELKIV